ncbi:MAG: hypothetical protein ACRCWG_15335 [Sarcina sp.]
MKQFLTPFNIKIYDAVRAYKELKEVDWKIRTKTNIGDIVYFYSVAPVKKIVIKAIVTGIDREFTEMIDDSEFYTNKNEIRVDTGVKYTRIQILSEIPEEKSNLLTLELLRENGLKGSMQSTLILDNNKELLEYINSIY